MIELHMLPATPPMSGSDFKKMAGPYSIALDGFVNEGPWFDSSLPSVNFNHHEGCSRLETRATCAQVLLSIRQGFFKKFQKEGHPTAHVYVNDTDEDCALSWFLLKNHRMASSSINPMLNRLVHMSDMMDTTAGAYSFPEDLSARAWIFEPYRRFRLSGGLNSRSSETFTSVITDVENRIMLHLTGQGKCLPIDTRYEILFNEPSYVHVHETGAQAREGMFSDGITAFVSSSPRSDGNWSHVVGRISHYINFPVLEILDALNIAESLADNPDRWGGGETIGGSPRIAGSGLPPKEVAKVIKSIML